MARKQRRYPPEFRQEIVALVRSGRSPEALAREFEPSASAIRKWAKQADLDEGHRNDGLTTFERPRSCAKQGGRSSACGWSGTS